jgi:hypothetical protein
MLYYFRTSLFKKGLSENDAVGVINRRNGFGATQAFSKKA